VTLEAVLWDSDSTLVDSRPLHFRKHQEILRTYGIELDPAHEENIYKWNAPKIHEWLVDSYGLTAERDLYVQLVSEWYNAHAHELMPGPGVGQSLQFLHERSVPMAVVSNGRRASVDVSLGSLRAAELIDVIVTKEDVMHLKPHPEPYQLALTRLEKKYGRPFNAAACLAIDDHEDGIASATGAGVAVYHINLKDPVEKLPAFLERAYYGPA
jgi:HAD superfamily hydrolase (TIGR01509 family)